MPSPSRSRTLTPPTRPDAVARLPLAPGVYRFRDVRGRVLYIGRATRLRRRVRSYWSDLGGREHLAVMVARIARIEAVVCDSEHEAAWLERNLLEQTMPTWNRTPGGQEVPVYIRLDPRPAAPGLSVVHTTEPNAVGARLFGPYLGGERVRLAVAALDRVLPLPYAGTRLNGSQREMAGERGVGPSDRDALIGTLTEVLQRDPSAVASLRRELRARRDLASDLLAFERAARVQSEIDAIEWITSPQRVTSAEPFDHDVFGWAAGILVQFRLRAGRLCRWTQRTCTPAGARPHLATTPAAWAEFADRNAELAARLTG